LDDIYRRICVALQQYKTVIDFANVNPQKVVEAYNKVILDHPELFWAGGGGTYTLRRVGFRQTISFMPTISDSSGAIKRKQDELENVVSEILRFVDKNWTAYEKALYLHDYLIHNTTYDKEACGQMTSHLRQKKLSDSSNAYGCLTQRKAICSGYSRAYQMLLSRVGVQSGRVTGQKKNGEKHEWNYIKLDDGYHYVDVTWDEPEVDGCTGDVCTHEFFCITSSELAQTHILDSNQFIPVCNSSKYDYYRYFGCYFNQYDFRKISSLFSNITLGKSVEIKFGSSEALKIAVEDLFMRNQFFNIRREKDSFTSVKYSVGVSGRILYIVGT
jgi:hypothetical protein